MLVAAVVLMHEIVMMLEVQGPVLTQLPSTEESPLSMSDCESLENICDYEEIYNHKATVEEIGVIKMDKNRLPKVKVNNKGKPITKIFKDRTFSPSLEDIKEVEDKSKDDFDSPYFLSLSHVHYDRAFHGGFLDKDKLGRRFRNEYWKSYQQGQKSSRRRTISWWLARM